MTRAEEGRPEEAGGAPDPTEEAGETTAAGMVSGPADDRPVGADTMVKVGRGSGGEGGEG